MKEKKEDGVSPSHNRLTWSDQVELEVKVLIIKYAKRARASVATNLFGLTLLNLFGLGFLVRP